VRVAELNAQARAAMRARDGMPLRDRLLARPDVAGRLARPLAPLANRTLASPAARRVLEAVAGIHRDAALPPIAPRTLQSWARRRPAPAPGPSTVVYFHGCAANWNEPRTGRIVIELLEHQGLAVAVPPQGCCGLPLLSNGDLAGARAYVRRLAAALAPHARAGALVVASSTSCGLMLKREAREVLELEGDADLAAVAPQVRDVSELLLGLADAGELRDGLRPLPLRIPYHQPCQARGHGLGKPALELLRLVPGLEPVELDRACCGVAGTYGLKREKHAIAMDVGRALFADVRALRPELSACDSETCRWQIESATGVRTRHPVEFLLDAYRAGDAAAG
jgi:glycerol-3-phosphate dehydrogenase subunit C